MAVLDPAKSLSSVVIQDIVENISYNNGNPYKYNNGIMHILAGHMASADTENRAIISVCESVVHDRKERNPDYF